MTVNSSEQPEPTKTSEIHKDWIEFLSGVYEVYRNCEVSSRELRKFADENFLLTSLWLADPDSYKEKLIRDRLNDYAFILDSGFTVIKFADDRFSIVTDIDRGQVDVIGQTIIWLPFLNNLYKKFGSNDVTTAKVSEVVELAEKTAVISNDPKANKFLIFKDALAKIHGTAIGDYRISFGSELREGSQTVSVKRVYLNPQPVYIQSSGNIKVVGNVLRTFFKPVEPVGQLSPEDIWTNSWVEFLEKAHNRYGTNFIPLSGWVEFYRSLKSGRGRSDEIEFYMTNLISKDFGGFVVNTRISSTGEKEFSVMKSESKAVDTSVQAQGADPATQSADSRWTEFFDRVIDCLGSKHLSSEMLVNLAIAENLLDGCVDLKSPSRFTNMAKTMVQFVYWPLRGFRVNVWNNIGGIAGPDVVSISFDIIKLADLKPVESAADDGPVKTARVESNNSTQWQQFFNEVVKVFGSDFNMAGRLSMFATSNGLLANVFGRKIESDRMKEHLNNMVLNPIEGFTVIVKNDLNSKVNVYSIRRKEQSETCREAEWARFLQCVMNQYGSNFITCSHLLSFAVSNSLLTNTFDKTTDHSIMRDHLENIILNPIEGFTVARGGADPLSKIRSYSVQRNESEMNDHESCGESELTSWTKFLGEVHEVYGSTFITAGRLLRFAASDSLLTNIFDENTRSDRMKESLDNIVANPVEGFVVMSKRDLNTKATVYSVLKKESPLHGKRYSIQQFLTALYAEFKESELHFHSKVAIGKVQERHNEDLSSSDSKILFDKLVYLMNNPSLSHDFGNGMVVTFMYSEDLDSFYIVKKAEDTNLVRMLNKNVSDSVVKREMLAIESLLINASLSGLKSVFCGAIHKETYFHFVASGLTINQISPEINEISWK